VSKLSACACAFAILVVAELASAGTLTLSGSCTKPLNGNTLVFAISNSGLSNDTAYSIGIQPVISRASVASSWYPVNSLMPGASANVSISMLNITAKGTYADYFITTYRQGIDVFTTVFPCLVSFQNSTASQVYLSPSAVSGANSTESVIAAVTNAGTTNVTANVSLILPPTFSYSSSRQRSISLAPYTKGNVSFSLVLPPGAQQVSYGVAAAVQYYRGNLSYATYVPFTISAQKPGSMDFGSIILWSFAAVIVLLLVLLVLSFSRKRRKSSTA